MKDISKFICEAKYSDDSMATMFYLIYKLYHSGKQGANNVKWMLERMNDDLSKALFDFINKADFEDMPEMLGDGEGHDVGLDVEELLPWLDHIKDEEIDQLLR